jgi:hypothetical protein
MVQILPRPPREPSTGERFAQAFSNIGQQVPGLVGQHAEAEAIKRLTGKDVGGLSPEMKRLYLEKFARHPQHEQITKALIGQGASPEDAELYAMLTTGGQTAYVKELLEAKKRAGKIPGQEQRQPGAMMEQEPEKVLSPEEKAEKELQRVIEEQDVGLTPAEKVARGKERFDSGLKVYQEAGTKLRNMARDKERLDLLENLNKSEKLPTNLGRLNVDKEGNLRLPFLASNESQRYVKTLNEFSSGAKDTFGSRVTNFDLTQYLKRFPTLLNSKEGREQLLQQMKIVNQINAVHYKSLKDVYDQAGGARKIDADVAERLAEMKSETKVNELVKKFDKIGTSQGLPSARKNKGERFQDDETGEIFFSDGTSWVKES